jgi:hypothetical protein
MKKELAAVSMLFVLSLGFAAVPTHASSDGDSTRNVKLEEDVSNQSVVTAVANQNFTITMQIDDDIQNIAALQAKIVFSQDMCQGDPEIIDDPTNVWDVNISSLNNATVVSIAYAMATTSNGSLNTNDGPLDIVKVRCLVAAIGDGTMVNVTLQDVLLGDAEENEVTQTPVNMVVTIAQPQKGDVDDDTDIDIFDMIRQGRIIVGDIVPTQAETVAADVNPDQSGQALTCGNGVVDVFDMIRLGQAIVSGEGPIPNINATC